MKYPIGTILTKRENKHLSGEIVSHDGRQYRIKWQSAKTEREPWFNKWGEQQLEIHMVITPPPPKPLFTDEEELFTL